MKRTRIGISENFSYKIVALLITLILWVIILGTKDSVVIKKLAVDFLLPRNMMIVNGVPKEVSFKVSGPRAALKKLAEQHEPLVIDLTSALPGLTTIKIHPDSVNLPVGVHVLSLSPGTVTPKLEETVVRKVPLQVIILGVPAPGYSISHIAVQPPFIELTGARSVIEEINVVKTEPVNVTGVDTSLSRRVTLDVERPGVLTPVDTTAQVAVTISGSAATSQKKLKKK